MEPSKPKEFIASLQRLSEPQDRGALADLRHGVADATAPRAWPHIAPYCDLRKQSELPPFILVGAGFALHKKTDSKAGNLGNTLRRIAIEGKNSDKAEALNSFAARFRRLLTCHTTKEVCNHLPGILRAAARKNIPVNYDLLLNDLLHWSETVKLRWAAAYWSASTAEYEQRGEEK